MNTESVYVLHKRINDVDATCKGDIDAHLALCRLLGFVNGYVPGNLNLKESEQQYVLTRVLEILNACKK